MKKIVIGPVCFLILSFGLLSCGVIKRENICKIGPVNCLVNNGPPVALSGASGAGNAYQASQLGGLSFTRYGHNVPAGNQVSHDEMMDFLDDPEGNADGVRADGSVAQREYYFSGTSTAGWAVSDSNDKYADGNDEITPVAGGDFFGDTYRGYFVPPSDGIYQFSNTVLPDNGVRIMMSPSECPHQAIAVISTDIVGEGNVGGTTRTSGAVDPMSIWINGNGGAFRTSSPGPIVGTTNEYVHNTAAFYPGGSSNADYAHGDVYLKANQIYYIEIRYSEGGGGNNFAFGFNRRDFGNMTQDGVQNLSALDMLPFSGSDKYIPRQSCGGAYNAAQLFTDPDGDVLTYTARLVNSDGSAIAGAASELSYVGLAFDAATAQVSGTVNGNYTSQKIVFSAVDYNGSRTTVDASPIAIVP